MKKQVKTILGKENYLLGIDKEGNKVWLIKESWDCDWYWGFGYIETYNKRYTDIVEHTHFDTLFLGANIFHSFKDHFSECTLNDTEIWQLLELMGTFYTLRKAAELFHKGGCNISSVKTLRDILKSQEKENSINRELLPKVFEKVRELFEEKGVA